jgi:hypothetical protein
VNEEEDDVIDLNFNFEEFLKIKRRSIY